MAHGWLKTTAFGLALIFSLTLQAGIAVSSVKKTDVNSPLGVIVEKDLFRPTRQKPKPPKQVPKKAPEPAVVLPPPKSPPPSLTLSGTILLDSGNVALMSLQSASSGSGRYKIGDEIEGFRVTEITSENVVLKRDDEVLKVFMNSVQGVFQGAPAFANSQPHTTAQSQPQADIPPALVPRPQNPFMRAVPRNTR